jgi:hypothetical protein
MVRMVFEGYDPQDEETRSIVSSIAVSSLRLAYYQRPSFPQLFTASTYLRAAVVLMRSMLSP